MQDSQSILAQVNKPGGNAAILKHTVFRGFEQYDLRHYYLNKEEELTPSRKGLTLPMSRETAVLLKSWLADLAQRGIEAN